MVSKFFRLLYSLTTTLSLKPFPFSVKFVLNTARNKDQESATDTTEKVISMEILRFRWKLVHCQQTQVFDLCESVQICRVFADLCRYVQIRRKLTYSETQ